MSLHFFLGHTHDKPNRLEFPDKNTNPDYHARYAKYAISNSSTHLHNEFIRKTQVNKHFYKGKQWEFEEDLEAFLKDDTGQDRNRIKIVQNIVRPLIEQFRGNAIRMVINARVKSISKMSIKRMEDKLKEKLFLTDVANEMSSLFAERLRKEEALGKDRAETKRIFNNLYRDEYIDSMNKLLKFQRELNQYGKKQLTAAENLGLSGLVVLENYLHGGHNRTKVVPSENFFFDRSAIESDLTDCDHQGKLEWMTPSDIFERWQSVWRDTSAKKAIEDYVTSNSPSQLYHLGHNANTSQNGPRVPVYYVYWRDYDTYEYGYVTDEFGLPLLDKINFTEPGSEKPKWTDADLIDPPDTPKNRDLFGGKKKRNLVVDVLRRCIIIPSDVLGRQESSNEKPNDIICEFGAYPYQETNYMDPSNVKFPFKCQTWAYVDGEVLSPVDDVINPQRFINRIMSVTESQINNSGGAGFIYDKDAVDPQTGEAEIMRSVAQGKPVGLRSKGRGIPNMMTPYDATPKQGTYNMYTLVDQMKRFTQETTGVNDPLQGASTGPDQLVGVTELLIQRGSLLQEPFYYALADVFLQNFQFVATVVKRMYINNERELVIATDDSSAEIIKLAKDMYNEDFQAFVKRDNSDEILISAGNQQLQLFKEIGLIDEARFANLWNRSTPEDISRAIRDQAGDNIEAARLAQQQQSQQEAQLQEQLQSEQEQLSLEADRAEAQQAAERLAERQHDLDQIAAKSLGKISENLSKQSVV